MPAAPSPAATAAASARRLWLGLALLLASAAAFSLHNVLARLTYDHGLTPTTIAATRTWAILALLMVMFGRHGHWPRVPRPAWRTFAVTALGYAVQNPLLLVAFLFVPVSLAVLVLYLFPLFVAFFAAAIGQDRLTPRILAAAGAAFAGVALVLEIWTASFDWRGVALSAIAAVALAVNIVGAAQLTRHLRPLDIPYALSCVGAVVFGALMFADGGPALPASTAGWWLFAAAVAASPVALVTFYLALPLAGASRSAMAMNSEPVITVFLAVLLLGEALTPLQGAGAVLIVGAIAAAVRARMPARRG
jgi:drug/metabolite transporter (DMT)-like permease